MFLKKELLRDSNGEIPMAIGFVLLHVPTAYENEVFNTLSKLPEVLEVHPVSGEYDIVAKIQAKDYETIAEIIKQKIKTIPGVTDTKTLTGKNLR